MSDEIKDQRIGNLRQALVSTRDSLRMYRGFEHFVRQVSDVLDADALLAEHAPETVGEQVRQAAVDHRCHAIRWLKQLLLAAGMPSSAGNMQMAEELIEHIVAASGYEAESRIRIRLSQSKP